MKVEFYDNYGGSNRLSCSSMASPFACPWQPQSGFNGSQIWTARAYDAVGNCSTSSPVSVIVNLETNRPTVSIISPLSGSVFSDADTVTITAVATDNTGLAKVEFYDGLLLKGTTLSMPFTFD